MCAIAHCAKSGVSVSARKVWAVVRMCPQRFTLEAWTSDGDTGKWWNIYKVGPSARRGGHWECGPGDCEHVSNSCVTLPGVHDIFLAYSV